MALARPFGRLSGTEASCFALLLLFAACRTVNGQIVSPGRLSAPHAELNGLRNCTSCHELGKRGVAAEKCLACHRPLAQRLAAETGFHATIGDGACSDCHVEHFGEEFELVRFDTAEFDHESVGYRLETGHAGAECRNCHNAILVADEGVRDFKGRNGALNRTFLGLGSECVGCHSSGNPHEDQFAGRGCAECHEATAWERAELFDHDTARYRLTGRHQAVACAGCHPPTFASARARTPYTGLEFSRCESCHADPHNGAMADACSDCHGTRGWQQVDRSRIEEGFVHSATGFTLVGAHSSLACGVCHGRPPTHSEDVLVSFVPGTESYAYPRPVSADCLSCHQDYHEAAFDRSPGGVLCENCHGQKAWIPTRYDIERHNRETFELAGAHIAVPCFLCHRVPEAEEGSLRFHFESTECATCHRSDDPHGSQFADEACNTCHEGASFRIAEFDHDRTKYPLDGAHRDVACGSCHAEEEVADGVFERRYKPIGTQCRDCHRA